jgi:RIO kinase 3
MVMVIVIVHGNCASIHRMNKFLIPCPSAVLLKKHILVMTFIGSSQNPAPKLKDAHLSPTEWQLAYEQCVQVR